MVKQTFIPHQIHLSKPQMVKLGQGLGVNMKHSQMGADKGDVVVMLKPQTARKMLTSYKKGKGMRLMMSPDELDETVMRGAGFFKSLKKWTGINKTEVINSAKKIGKEAVQHGAEVAGTAIGAYLGNPAMGAAIGSSLGKAGTKIIDSVEPTKAGVKFNPREGVKSLKADAKRIGVEAIDRQLDKLDPDIRAIAEEKLSSTYPNMRSSIIESDGRGLYGGKVVKGSKAAKDKMAALRAMKSGGKIGDSIKKAFNKSSKAVSHAAVDVGDALTSRKAMNTYKTIGRHAIEQGIPLATTLASMALGDPTGMSGAMVGNVAQEYASRGYSKGTGRPRGRPRKNGGALATMSKPFQQALRLNKNTYGLSLGGFSSDANLPVSDFKTNPRVQPSSREMTLSPYQLMSSPAMNPFVPTYSYQAGGQSCGYGGKGLY